MSIEVGLFQVRDGLAGAVAHDDIDTDEIDAGAKDRRRLRRIGGGRLLLGVTSDNKKPEEQ